MAPPLYSILRHALDKIAEIKSLLEERRIGEDGAPCERLPLGGRSSSPGVCVGVCVLQLPRLRVCTVTATPPGRQ